MREDAEGIEGIEVVGRTLDEAVQKGLEHLGLRRDQVRLEVIADGTRSLFGFRAGPVRVRLIPKSGGAAAEEAEKARPATNADEEADLAYRILCELLRRMKVRARVTVERATAEQPLRLNIVGKDLGSLIGRRGETLAAMQFLLRLMVSHQLERWVGLLLDVNDYRRRREESLQRLALRMAELAVQTGQIQELEPMPPAERRLIHVTLRDFAGVRTESRGEGEGRRVLIIPTRAAS
jgi:spoIIIJ-associated protein